MNSKRSFQKTSNRLGAALPGQASPGSVLATIGLTIPSVLVVNHLIERPTVLGVEHTDLVLLILTLALSIITFTSGRTNMLQGVVHLLLFAAYILFIFQS